MHGLPKIIPGDLVDVIAPASRCTNEQLTDIRKLLESWGLKCRIPRDIFGDDLLCANSDSMRARLLLQALQNEESKVILCARGGYGCLRLMSHLPINSPSRIPKVFIGMSDATVLLLYFMQKWQWPVIHGALAPDKFSTESIQALRNLLFDKSLEYILQGTPLNEHAQSDNVITAPLIGGNLAMIQTSLGTSWQIDTRKRILFLEEVNERGYRIDRALEHIRLANLFEQAEAIIFGEFTGGHEPNGHSLIEPVLKRFAESCNKPVLQIRGIGHTHTNFPLPFGLTSTISLGKNVSLKFQGY